MKKFLLILISVLLCANFIFAQEISYDDTSIPMENDDLTNAIAVVTSGEGSGPALLQGMWIEATSHNTSIIRDIATGEKSGYEFDNSTFATMANWWFWGDITPNLHLDAEIAVWDLEHVMYQANSYAANIPDVTFGDGVQGLLAMLFSPINGLNNDNPGVFNKLGFTIKTPFVNTRFGYGDLGENTMSGFTGIYNVIDPWDFVGKGFVEFTLGNKAKKIGDNVELNVLLGLSRMRGEYGMYSVVGGKFFDIIDAAFTFTSTTMSSELFRYNEQNDNAASAYIAVQPVDFLTFEVHGLTAFGTEINCGMNSSAAALRVSSNFGANEISLTESFAGKDAQTIWGYDSSLDVNSFTSSLMYWYKNDALVSAGLDASFKMNEAEKLSDGLWNIRFQPMADVNWSSIIKKDITTSLYASFDLDRIDSTTDSTNPFAFYFEEAGIEIVLDDIAPSLKKLTFDYAACPTYSSWTKDDGYKLDVFYHSVMLKADISDTLSATMAGIYRGKTSDDAAHQPIGLAAGVSIKTDIKFLGKPTFWLHMTYGMDPYEDVNYDLYRADDSANKPAHRTYKLNSLDSATTESRISFGFIWDL